MDHSEKNNRDNEKENAVGYGGYSTRHDYERLNGPKKGRTFAVGVAGAAILCLLVLAALGVFALTSGKLFPKTETEGEQAGTIRVPTQSELQENARTPMECLELLESSLITLEVKGADGESRFGSAFLVSVDGYAVCSPTLFPSNGLSLGVTAYFSTGHSMDVRYVGKSAECGIALVKLTAETEFNPVSAGNFDFVKRGQTLLVAGSVYSKFYYGTAVSGMVSSVGKTVQAGQNEAFSVPVAYLDVLTNPSLYGAPVLNDSGLVVGFCTGAIKNEFGDYVAIIPINAVYTIVNDILANS